MITPQELLDGHLDRVYTLALRLAGNPSDAWDLTQDALLRALRGLPSFRQESQLDTWLFRITVNTWKSRVSSARWRWWSRLLPLDASGRDPLPTPEKSAEKEEGRRQLDAALAALAPEDRAALVLRELEGKSYQEIAEILDVPMGTVKSRLHRARGVLAENLEKSDEP